MANFSEEEISAIWKKALVVENVDSNEWRKDACEAWINRNKYGDESLYGWEIDHILPIAKGGTDQTDNLRAFHWKNNRSKGDNFPSYTSAMASNGNKNIEKEDSKTVHETTIEKLRSIYPNNSYVKNK